MIPPRKELKLNSNFVPSKALQTNWKPFGRQLRRRLCYTQSLPTTISEHPILEPTRANKPKWCFSSVRELEQPYEPPTTPPPPPSLCCRILISSRTSTLNLNEHEIGATYCYLFSLLLLKPGESCTKLSPENQDLFL